MEEVKDEEELLKRDKQNYLLEVKKLKKTANSVMEGTTGMGQVSNSLDKLNLFNQTYTDSMTEPM